MNNKVIYFDNNATTKIDPRVLWVITKVCEESFANPSAREHLAGENAHRLVKKAFRVIGTVLCCKPDQITITSGATESINQAVYSICQNISTRPARLLVSPLEHKAVIATCRHFSKTGLAEIMWLHNDKKGNLSLQEIENNAKECDAIIVMAANNELGNIYPFIEIGKIADKYGCEFVCDASQAIGKIPFCFDECKATYLIGSAHKFYGPKGIGILISEHPHRLHPLIYGGGQQNFKRSGTLDVPSIVGMAKACKIFYEDLESEASQIKKIRDKLEKEITIQLPDALVLGNKDCRLPGTTAIAFPNIPNDAILARVSHKLFISTGSACTIGVEESSHVYRSLGLSDDITNGIIRISAGRFNTMEEASCAANELVSAVQQIKAQFSQVAI